jgi:AAA domain
MGMKTSTSKSKAAKPQNETANNEEPWIRFFTPSELRNYEPEANTVLVGDCHISKGEVFVIGGEPGVGKSTAATELAFCGATGNDWFGLQVHAKFKTMIIQTENSRHRLKQEFLARCTYRYLDKCIFVSEPPPYGLPLTNPKFQTDVMAYLDRIRPDIVLLDPWNAAAKDAGAAEYGATFDALRNILPTGKAKPALGVVAHTRKPRPEERRTGGPGLMHLLAGSYVLTSVPRAIFMMVRGDRDDETDTSVVLFNPKNNNGGKMARSAWICSPEGYSPLPEFDWDRFDGTAESRRKVIGFEHIVKALGTGELQRRDAVKRIMEISGLGRRACEKAIAEAGKFAAHLCFDGEQVKIRTNEHP